jgi:hypothetical protein
MTTVIGCYSGILLCYLTISACVKMTAGSYAESILFIKGLIKMLPIAQNGKNNE